MSFDTSNYWFYQKKGRKLHILQMGTGSLLVPESELRLTPAADELIYPSEAITNGLRIEYTALTKPFIDKDPETIVESLDAGGDGGYVEVTSPSEASHVNLNTMLSLAIVEYIKAKVAERRGDLKEKEYHMRDYYKKLSDNESNLKKVFITGTQPVFALK